MKYEVIKGCVIAGKNCQAGSHVDLEDQRVADNLMAIGRLIPVFEEVAIEDRALEVTESFPKIKKRVKAK